MDPQAPAHEPPIGPLPAPPGAPTPPMPSSDERTWASLTHASALAGLVASPFGYVLAPLVMWLIKRNDSAYVDRQGKAALNFQFLMTALFLLLVAFAFVSVGGLYFNPLAVVTLPLVLVAGVTLIVLDVVFVIQATMAASKGEEYRYPISLPLL